jgi:hypothetical protein
MWTSTHKVDVDGGEAVEVTEGLVEVYMVYQCMVYISQYLPRLAENMNVPRIWHLNSINKFEGEVLLGKGKMRTVKGNY